MRFLTAHRAVLPPLDWKRVNPVAFKVDLEEVVLLHKIRAAPGNQLDGHVGRDGCQGRVHGREEAFPSWKISPIAKQAAVGSALEVIGEYARLSAAAGGFDRSEAQLRRALLRLDARGFTQLSNAIEKLLDRAEKIESDAAKRLGAGADAIDTGLGLMLFEAAQLSNAPVSGAGTGPGKSRRRPLLQSPFTFTSWWRVCRISTRSAASAMTWSTGLYAAGISSRKTSLCRHSMPAMASSSWARVKVRRAAPRE